VTLGGSTLAQPGVAAGLRGLGVSLPYQRPAGLLSLFGREAFAGRTIPRGRCIERPPGYLPSPNRFWSRVRKLPGDGCWLSEPKSPFPWRRPRNRYGVIYSKGWFLQAHRVAWELTYGPIPLGIEVCHNCPGGDNPACVRPDHLFLDTQHGNNLDASAKGMLRGRRQRGPKLDREMVVAIRERAASEGISTAALAAEVGVSLSVMSGILTGRFWHSAGGPLRRRWTRLTWTQAYELRQRAAAGESTASLRTRFGLGPTQIGRIVRGEQWVREPGPTGPRRIGRPPKLAAESVLEIRRLNAEGIGYRRLARRFGVSPSMVGLICTRKAWAWL
jgi:DNA invertase Pin-like site-specific DNA recombinase